MPLKISKTNFQSAGNPWLHQEFEYKTWYWKEKSWWSFKIDFSAKDRILKIRIENKRSWREGKKEFSEFHIICMMLERKKEDLIGYNIEKGFMSVNEIKDTEKSEL